jgi:tetratricopeptide (TPR) repeat protein
MTREEFEIDFNEAMRLKNDGLHEAAVQILGRLLDAGHHPSAVTGMLGLILYYDLHDPRRALPYLRQSVVMSPNSERASMGLFHALLDTEQVDEAFAEAWRYLADHTSEAYEAFLKDVAKPEHSK